MVWRKSTNSLKFGCLLIPRTSEKCIVPALRSLKQMTSKWITFLKKSNSCPCVYIVRIKLMLNFFGS